MKPVVGAACLLLVVFAGVTSAQEVSIPGAGFTPGWQLDGEPLVFEGQNLYGHINGGAELFHEFGFDRLLVQRYVKEQEELDLEIYIMTSHTSALGIYLSKAGKELPVEGVQARNTGGASQLTMLRGNYFVQINNFYGHDSLVPHMVALGNLVMEKVPEDTSLAIWRHLSDNGMIEGSARLVRGEYALQSIYTFGPGDMLQLRGEVFGVVGRYRVGKEGTVTHIKVPYPDEKRASEVLSYIRHNLDSYHSVLHEFGGGFIWRDYKDEFGVAAVDSSVLNLVVNIPQMPDTTTAPADSAKNESNPVE